MPEAALDAAARALLATIAREAVVAAVRGESFTSPPAALPGPLGEPGASFVTLTKHGALRGCIGSIEARRPLAVDVAMNARAAARSDLRFAPVDPEELPAIEVELSVLTAPEPIPAGSRAELVAALEPGVDGLVLEEQGRRVTFLPSVWRQLASPESFLSHLERKGSLAVGSWSPARRAFRYRTESIEVGPALGA